MFPPGPLHTTNPCLYVSRAPNLGWYSLVAQPQKDLHMSDDTPISGSAAWGPDPSNRMPPELQSIYRIFFLGGCGGIGVLLGILGQITGSGATTGWGASLTFCGLIGFGLFKLFDLGFAGLSEFFDRHHAKSELRRTAALDAGTAPRTLAELARCKDPEIRRAVAQNKHTPRFVLEKLATDSHRYIRQEVAINPQAGEALLLKIVATGDVVVCEKMLRRDSVTRRLPMSVREAILRTVTV